MKGQEKKGDRKKSFSPTRRQKLPSEKRASAYNVYQPDLNLSKSEYEKMIQEIKKRANFG